MSDEQLDRTGTDDPGEMPAMARRSVFTRRNMLSAGGVVLVVALIIGLLGIIAYRIGWTDSYIKGQFVAKMEAIGIVFTADSFRVTIDPLELHLTNATFNDKLTGEKLFFIRDATIGLTVENLYAWQLSRDIKVNSTEINGAEVWITFDENGRSNFANLVDDSTSSNLNFKYESVKFTLRESVIHFGDLSRNISADANNVHITLVPEDPSLPADQIKYRVSLDATDSRFEYNEGVLNDITVKATALANSKGAEISDLQIKTPIGTSFLKGSITDWVNFTYDLYVESTVDLTQASTIFPLGASLGGVGNFKGTVAGSGETYKVDGVVDSQAISAEGIYLKALNVDATVEGTNSNYEANGTAIAELLTFEDFRIDFPQISGNVRGTGSDFRWVGELQAVAAKSKSLTLGRLFLSDAVAEFKDRELVGSANGRAHKFSIDDIEFADLQARNMRFSLRNGSLNVAAPGATAGKLSTPDFELTKLSGRDLKVDNKGERTEVKLRSLEAGSADFDGIGVTAIRADDFTLVDLPNGSDITLRNVRADRASANGTIVEGIVAPLLTINDNPADTVIYSDSVRVAKIDTGTALLGSLNIGGVRVAIRQGRIEARSNDFDAGTVLISENDSVPEGGRLENVSIAKPVFVLEPSGRYRASADMSIGGGVVGSIPLGTAQAKVDVNNDRVQLNDLVADVMDGRANGSVEIGLRQNVGSIIRGNFAQLDLSKLVAMQAGRVLPLEGKASGSVDLTLRGTDIKTTSGSIKANIEAAAGDGSSGQIPINGDVSLSAAEGLFIVENAELNSPESKLIAVGRFDLRKNDSDLLVDLTSDDASEVDRIVRVLGISPALERELNDFQVQVAGSMRFNGRITGNLGTPDLEGSAEVASVSLRGREVGSLRSEISISETSYDFKNGLLREPGSNGQIAFDISIPAYGSNNTKIDADLTSVNAGNLLSALPLDLPERLRNFEGQTSGTVRLTGLPDSASGEINLSASNGKIAGESFDGLSAKAVFSGTRIEIETAEVRVNDGKLEAKGFYDRATTQFDLDLRGRNIPLQLAASLLPPSTNMPTFTGLTDVTGNARGFYDRPDSYDINFNGRAQTVVINGNEFGDIVFGGKTEEQVLKATINVNLEDRPQKVNAVLDFRDPALPFTVEHLMIDSPLRPFFALVPQLKGISIGGTGSGRVFLSGELMSERPDGTREFSTAGISGSATFTQLSLLIQDTPLTATETVVVRLSPNAITFDSANFAGSGSNLTIAGTKALTDEGMNDLSINGRVNLALLNVIPAISATDTFFGGFADVAVRLSGVNKTARLIGTAETLNASIAAFLGTERLSFERVKSKILFTSNQAQIESAEGYLGGGRFTANGGVLLTDALAIDSYRIGLVGNNVTVPIPDDFITTGDARLEISGRRRGTALESLISGSIQARRSLYTKDIDLASIVGGRREGSISGGGTGAVIPTGFDLTIDGRNALVVRNNIADLTASVSLRLTGTSANPQISGRIVATEGTVFFRRDRYTVQRGVLEFPPNTSIEPIISLIAESEIGGYQVFVNLSGPLTDTELLNATVRSSPSLPQADVISLITTGSLSNTESGIPTIASTGINTAAEVLTDSIINNPARRATDRLFGLNVFEIDPIISGDRVNPTARLTVGRQINNNLRVTYATNLSQDQNQVVALEYRVSNRLSVVAQYEQRSLSNVTSNRDNFSIEVRFRKRF